VACWCRDVRVSAESLALVSEPDRRRVCLCRRCAEAPPRSGPEGDQGR
jgi:hypothetical protein